VILLYFSACHSCIDCQRCMRLYYVFMATSCRAVYTRSLHDALPIFGALLRGTKREEVERGQVLAAPGSITPHTRFQCEAYILTKDRKSTRLNSSHQIISYAVFCLKKKTVLNHVCIVRLRTADQQSFY